MGVRYFYFLACKPRSFQSASERASSRVQSNDLAVDVGCGSGQGTLLLAPHFTCVVGTDISPAQLEMGRKHVNIPNVSYRESPAEELPFEDGSVDLVTAMSAFHWFDHSRFLQEAHRVLKPNGCLAVLNYTMDMELSYGDCSETLNHICNEVRVIRLILSEHLCVLHIL
uniref:Zgc:162780 n=1 Tax=Cyprinus carpio TaxID=7962 RepID=A0A8C2E6X2_CYPCA